MREKLDQRFFGARHQQGRWYLSPKRASSPTKRHAFLGREFLRQFAEDQGYGQPEHVQLNPRADSEPDIARAAGFLRCTLAGAQALWELINAGRFMFDGTVRKETPSQSWTKCVNSQAVYPLSEQHGLEAQERR